MTDQRPAKSSGLVVVGAIVVGIGLLLLLGSFGFLPIVWATAWWSRLKWPIVLIVGGAAVILFASRGGDAVREVEDGPWRHGARLYRLRKDRWVAGVIGGLGRYFAVSPDALRLVFLALVLLGMPWAVGAYIILAILVPEEPEAPEAPGASAVPGPPVAPAVPARSEEPARPAAPEEPGTGESGTG